MLNKMKNKLKKLESIKEKAIAKLKKVAQLRMQIRRAGLQHSPEVVKQGWGKLRQVMIS